MFIDQLIAQLGVASQPLASYLQQGGKLTDQQARLIMEIAATLQSSLVYWKRKYG